MLSRRVPQAPPPQAPSALPPHVQRAISQMPRPRSPTPGVTSPPPSSRPSSPVPYKSRQPNRPQTPVQPIAIPHSAPIPTDVQIDLVVDDIPDKDAISLNVPFTVNFTATTAAFVPPSKKRVLTLAVQHVIPSRQIPQSRNANAVKKPIHPTFHSPAPSGASTPRILSMDLHPSLVESPKIHNVLEKDSKHGVTTLPSPYADEGDASLYKNETSMDGSIHSGIVDFLGSSAITLPPFHLTQQSELITPAPVGSGSGTPGSATSAGFGDVKRISSYQFSLEFLPVKMGLAAIGGMRILLLSDTEEDLEIEPGLEDLIGKREIINAAWKRAESRNARILHEWPVVAEVWIGYK